MSIAESLTQKWLRQNIHPYSHKDRVYSDVDAVLSRFPTLRPKTDVYTYDDGRTQLLLCVHGLLPISFRQASYNIPIAIWVNKEYPRQPPIAYVVPTNDMLVKPGKYLDISGRCIVEYLQQWERKSEGCDLSALLEAMQEQFSREPPVYAKPRDIGSANSPSTQTVIREYPGRPPPPLPTTHSPPAAPNSAPLPLAHNARPTLPPKPGPSAINFSLTESSIQPAHPSGRVQLPLPIHSSTPLDVRPPPSLPPHPLSDPGPPRYRSSHGSPPIPPNYQSSSSGNISGPSVWPSGGSPQSHPTSHPWLGPPRQYDSQSAGMMESPVPFQVPMSPPSPPPPSVHSYYTVPLLPQPVPQVIPPSNVILHPPISAPNLLEEESPDSQYSSTPQASPFSVPPPPRPPNPELLSLHAQVHQKLTSELTSLSQVLSLDAERLRAHQTDLLAGQPAIRDEMARLEAVRDVCRNVAGRMRGTVEQAQRNVAELRRKGDPEVDELVCSTSIVHNQLINLVAEDNAIEDTIYHLHRALNTGRIDLERFLRTSRVLAEEQFMKRALIEKIQEGMPMGMSMGSTWS